MKPFFKHLFTFGVVAFISSQAVADIRVKEGFVRAMPPSAPNTAAYFTLVNHGDATKLVSVSTDAAAKAEIHTYVTENDVVKMRRVPELALPSHSPLTLTERGDHIMLLGLKAPLSEGQQVKLRLEFADGQSLELTLPVQRQAAEAVLHEHHNQH
ncbi:MAG: copper chaperone PCu(A)C [Plesiomonas shigelloides]